MKIVKKFNDFVNNRVLEDVGPIELPEMNSEMEEGRESTKEVEDEDQSNLIDEVTEEEFKKRPNLPEEEEEASEDEFEGEKKMRELSEMLDTDIQNNEILYKGNKITFASETMTFLINNKKPRQFGCRKENDPVSIKECLDKMNHSEQTMSEPTVESRRYIKRRK